MLSFGYSLSVTVRHKVMTLRGVQRTSNTPYQNVFLFDLKKDYKNRLIFARKN